MKPTLEHKTWYTAIIKNTQVTKNTRIELTNNNKNKNNAIIVRLPSIISVHYIIFNVNMYINENVLDISITNGENTTTTTQTPRWDRRWDDETMRSLVRSERYFCLIFTQTELLQTEIHKTNTASKYFRPHQTGALPCHDTDMLVTSCDLTFASRFQGVMLVELHVLGVQILLVLYIVR